MSLLHTEQIKNSHPVGQVVSRSEIALFANDLKIILLRVISKVEDYHQLQQDVNNLIDKWQLNFNVFKRHLLHLGKPYIYGSYNISRTQISTK